MNIIKRLWRRIFYKWYPHIVQGKDGGWYILCKGPDRTCALGRFYPFARQWVTVVMNWSDYCRFDTKEEAAAFADKAFPFGWDLL